MKYTWTPSVFAINDGLQSVVALLNPERYGASAEDAVYTGDGIYKDAATGQTRYARMYFSNGRMTRLFGFTGMDGDRTHTGADPTIRRYDHPARNLAGIRRQRRLPPGD